MSDLFSGSQPTGATNRQQYGDPKLPQSAAQPPEPPRYRTPTDVMRERRLREARKAEQQEAERLRQVQEDEIRRRPQQQEDPAGVEGDSRRPSAIPRPQGQQSQAYTIGGAAAQRPASSSQRPEQAQPSAQPRIPQQQPASFNPGHARLSSNTQRNRTEAYDTLNVPATAAATTQAPPQPQPQVQAQAQAQPQTTSAPQPASSGPPRAAFPHAFERWETLSSHWEGLTGYWIRRLEGNTKELDGKPLDQQLSRQITDLSAAGANLFHAVVELQRLRASSERKFQRWFFETRNEQEQAAERQANLERQLQAERDARAQAESVGSADAIRAEKAKAEELVREMRRELQISKEEARRAWEELGRREQEERERTIALRSGEPTLIGGVQVVPMQGMASRQATVQRPQTRDGTYPGGPTATAMGGMQPPQRPHSRSQTTNTSLDSPGEEHRQFSYNPARSTSPTSTDPFQETARPSTGGGSHQLRHEPDTQFYSSATQAPTSSAAMAAAASLATTNGQQQYYPQPPILPSSTQANHPVRSTTAQSGRSYVPSTTASSMGEEEYHINPDGSYTLDSRGRRIPYNQPILGSPDVGEISPPDHGDHPSDDDESYTSDIARERMYAQQYGSASASPARPPIPTNQPPRESLQPTSGNVPRPSALGGALPPLPPIPQGRTSAPISQPTTSLAPADYEGASYGPGWEGVTPRHRHPTRLSDIIEEQASRTSPSRGSYVSGSGAPPR
jgi:hypothetical protein